MLRNHGMEVVSFSTKRNLIFSVYYPALDSAPGNRMLHQDLVVSLVRAIRIQTLR